MQNYHYKWLNTSFEHEIDFANLKKKKKELSKTPIY